MAAIRWPRNCEYARAVSETKARTGHQKLARAVGMIGDPEARRLATEVLVDLADIRQLMAEAKYGNEGSFERANRTAGAINTDRSLGASE